jgi:hypothetical protein
MAGPDPAIPMIRHGLCPENQDRRVKPGDDQD